VGKETPFMSFDIPVDLQPFVAEQLRLGQFASEQDLMAEALRMLKAEREDAVEGILLGLADAAAGRVQPLAEVFDDLRREFNLNESV
jgi:hypothetical protein